MRLGYPCQNLTLSASTNHSLRLKSLSNQDRVHDAIRRNLEGLESILKWNTNQGWRLFRIGQHLVPFGSYPDFPFDWVDYYGPALERIGRQAQYLRQRLSMHPGQFINPGSPDKDVRSRGLAELRYSATALDLLGASDGVIVLHLGGAYDDRQAAKDRFTDCLASEPQILKYLALECDERTWPITDVVEVANRLGIPAIVDTLHHRINPDQLSLEDAFNLAFPTWGDRRPKIHLSSQDPDKMTGAHSARIEPDDFELMLRVLPRRDVDVMVEAKDKELALSFQKEAAVV
ncbi:MAG: UV damage repair endonuclease UvsE [Gemmatimonadetes bacterium]|nr:UV damage repair endonuclease UvsE [Gemmatimonadota bacterium]